MWSNIEEFADKQKLKLGFTKQFWTMDDIRLSKEQRHALFAENRKKYPLEWFVYVTMVDAIGDVIWPLVHKFNTVNYKLKNGLKKRHYIKVGDFGDWPDADGVIFEALKTTLIKFVEDECDNMYRACFSDTIKKSKKPLKNYGVKYLRLYINDKESSKDLKKAYKNILEAYLYFTKTRLQLEKDIEKKWDKKYKNAEERSNRTLEAMRVEDFMHKEDSRYLNLIVNSRQHMWT
jgi:hypothetical protein